MEATKLAKAERLLRRHRQRVIQTPDGSHAEACHQRAMRQLKRYICSHKPSFLTPYERIYLMD